MRSFEDDVEVKIDETQQMLDLSEDCGDDARASFDGS
jgi:hypothetical protein